MRKLFLLLLAGCAGCATAGSLDDTRLKAPDRILSEVLQHPYERVYAAARLSLLDLELKIEREDSKAGTLYAKSSPNLAKVAIYRTGFGESVGIYVTPVDSQQTKIEVVTQKSNRLEVGYKDKPLTLAADWGISRGNVRAERYGVTYRMSY